MNKNLVVVIPIYKEFENLSDNEKRSMAQCFDILNKRTIVFVCSNSLDTKEYQAFAQSSQIKISVMRFKNAYFAEISGYNKLMLDQLFYQAFKEFKFMFVYQLDAWVFRDELDYWIGKGYDFIGAPLFENFASNINFKFIQGLNGGLSLRSIPSSIKILKKVKQTRNRYNFFKIFAKEGDDHLAKELMKLSFLKKGYIREERWLFSILNNTLPNEDYVWSRMFSSTFSSFRVCPSNEALEFSFEYHPSYLYKINSCKLPMGAHAWEKYEPEFWSRFI